MLHRPHEQPQPKGLPMPSESDTESLRVQFCDAAKRGDIPAMKPYLDNTLPTDDSRMGVLIMAFSMAIKANKPESIELLLDYTKEAQISPPMLYSLAIANGGDEGLKMYQAAARKRTS